MRPKFIIEQHERNYAFTFLGENQNIILYSRIFPTKALCLECIDELIRTSADAAVFVKMQGEQTEYFFMVRNKKGVTIGQSPVYSACSSRDYAMRQLMQLAGNAMIEERLSGIPTYFTGPR